MFCLSYAGVSTPWDIRKNTVEITAQVIELKRVALFVPLIVYEANVNGIAETLLELPPIGAPSLRLPPDSEAKLYIHPDPEKRKRVMFTEKNTKFPIWY